LTIPSESTENLNESLLKKLKNIADDYNVKVDDHLPANYFRDLRALYKTCNSEVVVLINEYDAPVTRNMSNVVLTEANAKILHNFFATLKTMCTLIYALPSLPV
jgi:hypothetical protein